MSNDTFMVRPFLDDFFDSRFDVVEMKLLRKNRFDFRQIFPEIHVDSASQSEIIPVLVDGCLENSLNLFLVFGLHSGMVPHLQLLELALKIIHVLLHLQQQRHRSFAGVIRGGFLLQGILLGDELRRC